MRGQPSVAPEKEGAMHEGNLKKGRRWRGEGGNAIRKAEAGNEESVQDGMEHTIRMHEFQKQA